MARSSCDVLMTFSGLAMISILRWSDLEPNKELFIFECKCPAGVFLKCTGDMIAIVKSLVGKVYFLIRYLVFLRMNTCFIHDGMPHT